MAEWWIPSFPEW